MRPLFLLLSMALSAVLALLPPAAAAGSVHGTEAPPPSALMATADEGPSQIVTASEHCPRASARAGMCAPDIALPIVPDPVPLPLTVRAAMDAAGVEPPGRRVLPVPEPPRPI